MLRRCVTLTRSLASPVRQSSVRMMSSWGDIPMGPPDAILGLTEAYQKDTFEKKVNVGVGAYRDDNGKPYVLPSVRRAQHRLLEKNLPLEYAGIAGIPGFVKLATEFVYGSDSPAIKENRLAAVQSLSGTGALRVMFAFLARFYGAGTVLRVPTPTWGNHIPVARDAGLTVEPYRYYNKETVGLDFDGLVEDMQEAPEGTLFLLHACAHNPTGIDPSKEQWKELSRIMKEKRHVPLFDSAYQGFATGDADADAFAVRQFVDDGHALMLCQSFAKNFGLYGERVGTLSAVCDDKEEADRVLSQLKILIRPLYSSPPINGARIVEEVLSDPELRKDWYEECRQMALRIADMRQVLKDALVKAGSTRDWSHITDQIGMFCFSGLTPEQVERMVNEFHIYMTKDGRISMAGVNSKNVEYIAQSMHAVTK